MGQPPKDYGNIGETIGETIGDISSTIGETGNSSSTSLAFITDFSDFLGRLLLVISRVVFTLDYLYYMYMFFFRKSSSGGIR